MNPFARWDRRESARDQDRHWSFVKVGQVRTLSVERLGKRIGSVSPEELLQVTEGLAEIVGP